MFSLLELMVVVLSAIIVYIYADNDIDFILRVDINGYEIFWIAVYGLLYLVFLTRRVVLICMWGCMKDPRLKQSKINCLTFSILNSFEFIWFVYGNTFFYAGIRSNRSKTNLWKIFLAIILYGYVSMIIYIFSILGILSVFCIMRK